MTAAALLAFLRAGHTPRSGSFRALMRRGMQWISAAQPGGLGAFLRAQVLTELAARSAEERDRAAAEARRRVGWRRLARNWNRPLSGGTLPAPQAIQSLDDLRLAGILNAGRLAVPPGLLSGPQAVLAQTWAISLLDVEYKQGVGRSRIALFADSDSHHFFNARRISFENRRLQALNRFSSRRERFKTTARHS